ncbi:hypothetical protein FRC06_002878, partial [Ceratobasidium sp. 370]
MTCVIYSDQEKEEVILEALPSGVLIYRSQLADYKYRGHLFEDTNFFEFVSNTWEDDYRPLHDTANTTEQAHKR